LKEEMEKEEKRENGRWEMNGSLMGEGFYTPPCYNASASTLLM